MEIRINWANDVSSYLRKLLEDGCRENGLDLYEIMHYPVRHQHGERFRALIGSGAKAFVGVIWWERNWFSPIESTDFYLMTQPAGKFNAVLGSNTVADEVTGYVGTDIAHSVGVNPTRSGLWINIGFDRVRGILKDNKMAPKFRGNIDLSMMIPIGGDTHAFLARKWGEVRVDNYYRAQGGLNFAHLLCDSQLEKLRAAMNSVP